jgi:Tfp pilus assembly protein PilO
MSLAVVILAAAFVFFQFLPLNRKARELKAANTKLISENTISNAFIEAIPQVQGQIEEIKQAIGNFDAKVPQGRSHGIFLQSLAEVMQRQGLTELVIQPGIEVKADQLSSIPVDIRCKGRLVQIFRFFKAMESFGRVVRISGISIANDNRLQGVLTMNARVEIFYRIQDETAGN